MKYVQFISRKYCKILGNTRNVCRKKPEMLCCKNGWEVTVLKRRLVIDGNAVYEIDEECIWKKLQKEKEKEYEMTEKNKEIKEKTQESKR